jgi:carbonic anhydrase
LKARSLKFKFGATAVAAAALIAVASTASGAGAAWTYTGVTGPSHWKTIDPTNYATCADGTAQSPIDISHPVKTDLTNLKFAYVKGEAGIFNNGHTVEAEPLGTEKSTLTVDGVAYTFAQFHFHAPSEHEINAGKANAAWKSFTDKLNVATADPEATKVEIDWSKLLPTLTQTARYDGSLTTPGCSEGVKWNVFTNPITMSQTQINQFLEAYSGNNRPVQPLNNRVVKLDSTSKN